MQKKSSQRSNSKYYESKEIIIRPQSAWKLIDVEELIRYRELLYIFAWRDIKVRYKQTFLGLLWVIFQPLVTMGIFTVFFGNIAKIPSGNMPYSLFVLCGLVFWTYFSSTLSHASDSMVANESIIKKIYFPKILLPLSSVMTGFVDFVVNFVLLLLVGIIYGYAPSFSIVLVLPLAILVTGVTALGLGLLLASFNVKYRDVRYILPFFIQILLFVTPVIYPLAIMSDVNRIIMAFNPMSAVIESIRFVFSEHYALFPEAIIISIVSSITILFVGLWYFRKTEQFFADLV